MDIGTTIMALRKSRKVTQEELAKKCGLTQTSITQIETNKKRIRDDNLKKVCKYFKISLGGFYVMALTEEDVPKRKRKMFKAMNGIIKNIFFEN